MNRVAIVTTIALLIASAYYGYTREKIYCGETAAIGTLVFAGCYPPQTINLPQ